MYESATASNPLQKKWLVMRKDGDLLLLPPVYETIWQHCIVIHQGKLQLAINALQKDLAIVVHNHQPIYCGKAVLFWLDYEIWTEITLSDWTMLVWWSETAMEDVLEEARSKQWGWWRNEEKKHEEQAWKKESSYVCSQCKDLSRWLINKKRIFLLLKKMTKIHYLLICSLILEMFWLCFTNSCPEFLKTIYFCV